MTERIGYGYCPQCGRWSPHGTRMERRPNGDTWCGWCDEKSPSAKWYRTTPAGLGPPTRMTVQELREGLPFEGHNQVLIDLIGGNGSVQIPLVNMPVQYAGDKVRIPVDYEDDSDWPGVDRIAAAVERAQAKWLSLLCSQCRRTIKQEDTGETK